MLIKGDIKVRRRRRIKWDYIIYLARKGISKVGWISVGAYLVAMYQYAINKWTVSGFVLALALGILANYKNNKPE